MNSRRVQDCLSVTSKNTYSIYENLVTECFSQNRHLSGNTEFQKRIRRISVVLGFLNLNEISFYIGCMIVKGCIVVKLQESK